MNIFKQKKTFNITERDPTYRVKYLGNVLTAFMKGEGCVDKPASILWENHRANENSCLDMQMTISTSGLKVVTREQGLTEYRAHRIPYCICHPQYPRLFIWVYRHEGKRMKVEVRCHAVMCSTEAKAKAIAVQLHDKLAFALAEYTRIKTRRQNSRLVLPRANSIPNSHKSASGVPVRTMYLTVGQKFRPSSDKSTSAPKLGAITEDKEEDTISLGGAEHSRVRGQRNGRKIEMVVEEEEEDEVDSKPAALTLNGHGKMNGKENHKSKDDDALYNDAVVTVNTRGSADTRRSISSEDGGDLSPGDLGEGPMEGPIYEMEIGNDIDALKEDELVRQEMMRAAGDLDNDSISIESGFSEQDS